MHLPSIFFFLAKYLINLLQLYVKQMWKFRAFRPWHAYLFYGSTAIAITMLNDGRKQQTGLGLEVTDYSEPTIRSARPNAIGKPLCVILSCASTPGQLQRSAVARPMKLPLIM
jgi:hypothetical protein